MLYATVFTVDASRSNTAIGDTAITFAARGAMQPEAMVLGSIPGVTLAMNFFIRPRIKRSLPKSVATPS